MRIIFILLFLFRLCDFSQGQNSIDLLSPKYNTFFKEVNNEFWVASTTLGFNRSRGFETKHYLLNDSISGLEGTFIQSAVFQDTNGLLWTSTYEKLCYFNVDEDRFYCFSLELDGELITDSYHVFYIDINDNVLWLRAGGNILIYNTEKHEIQDVLGHTMGNWFNIIGDTLLGFPWVNEPGFELWSKNNGEWYVDSIKFENCELNDLPIIINGYYFEGNIWLVSTEQGVIKYDPIDPNRTVYYYSPQYGAFSNSILKGSKILISTINNGILTFDIRMENYLDTSMLQGKGVHDFFLDDLGNIWLSHFANGLISTQECFLLYQKKIDSSEGNWNFIAKKDDVYLIFNSESNLVLFKKNILQELRLGDAKIPLDIIVQGEILDSSTIFIRSMNKCFIYDIESSKSSLLDFNQGKQIDDVKYYKDTLFYIADSKLYFTLCSNRFRNGIEYTNTKEQGFQKIGIVNSEIKSFVTNSSHLYVIQKSHETLINVGAYINKTIYDQNTKCHYLATNAGLYLVDSTYSILHPSCNFGLSNKSAIHDIRQDSRFVYFTTDQRIGRFNKENLEFSYFTKWEFESTPAIEVDDSYLYIATKYVTRYETSTAFQNPQNIDLILDEFVANEVDLTKEIEKDYRLKLHHEQNKIMFKFYTNNWENSRLSKIKYRIEPIWPDWKMIDNGELVETPFLSPGKYQIESQAVLPDGSLTDVQHYEIIISNPWYKTPWFYSLSALFSIVFIALLYRSRIQRLNEQHRIQNEITSLEKSALLAQMNPHFIFNCLNSIQNFIMQNNREQAMDYLGGFAKLIRLNLNASAQEKVTLDDEINMLDNYLKLERMRFQEVFDYAINCPDDIDPNEVLIPPLLIQPFVENAVLHGMQGKEKDGKISIDFIHSTDYLTAIISDNGKGIDATSKLDEKRRSFGVSITQKRLEHINKHKDNYTLSSNTDHSGTRVEIKIKLS